jgi:Glycosyl hydrolases family 25
VTVFIADISSYQAGLTVAQLKAAGFSAVILKATEGTGWTDPQFAHWLTEARTLNFPVAAYPFIHPGNGDAQAAHFRSVVPADIPGWLDCEAGATRADSYAVAAGIRSRAGLVAGIYNGSQPAAGYGWWRAAYLSNPAGTPASAYAALGGDASRAWVGQDLWQFTSRCRIPGWSGDLDASAFRGTVVELLAHGWFQHRAIDPVTIYKEATNTMMVQDEHHTAYLFDLGMKQVTTDIEVVHAYLAANPALNGVLPTVPAAVLAKYPDVPGWLRSGTPPTSVSVDAAALAAALAGPLAAAVAADLPGSPAGTLTKADVETAVRAVLHNA